MLPAAPFLGAPPSLAGIARAWEWDPLLLAGLGLALGLYAVGMQRLWRRAGAGRGLTRGQVAAFYSGLTILALALISPLDAAGHVLFSVHMVQHVVLINLVAPLLVLGHASYGWLWALPRRRRIALARWWHRRQTLRHLGRLLTSPVAAWLIYAVALWLWHVPVAYQAALRSDMLHALEHLSFIGAAVLFWWQLLRRRNGTSASYGTGMVLAFTTMLHSGLLGALITFSPAPWYPNYVTNTAAWGVSALVDQQLAGAIMWVPLSLLYLVVTIVLLGKWLRRLEQHEESVARHVPLEQPLR